MTVEEDRLAAWLKDGTPGPPAALLADRIIRRAPRRHRARTIVPALAAACVVALIAVAIPTPERLGDRQVGPANTAAPRRSAASRTSATATRKTASPNSKQSTDTTEGIGIHPWHAHLISRFALSSLVTLNGRLYGVTENQGRIVRLGTDGRVLARSTVRSHVAPVAFDGSIWIVGPTIENKTDLISLDPDSLVTRVSRPVRIDARSTYGTVLATNAAGYKMALGSGDHITVLGEEVHGSTV